MKIPVAHIEVLFLLLLLFACNSHSYVGKWYWKTSFRAVGHLHCTERLFIFAAER